jgi:hypothetical protein
MTTMLSHEEDAALRRLETALWQRATRFDQAFLEQTLAPDFFEFGRSGRRYDRAATMSVPDQPLDCELPLEAFAVRALGGGEVQVTYISRVRYGSEVEVARRCSLWSRQDGRWVLRFHQGTPVPDEPA